MADKCIDDGQYDKAESLLNPLKETVREPGENLEYLSNSLCILGNKYNVLNRTKDAERVFKSSLHVIERAHAPDNWVAANDLTYLGRLFASQHRDKEAIVALKRSIEARKNVIDMLERIGASKSGIDQHKVLLDKDSEVLKKLMSESK
jgi:hypothetical protein